VADARRRSVVLALAALLAGRSRSLLSALGIAIGIASVTLLTGIGEGLRLYLLDSFSQFGTRLIAVTPGKTETAGGPPGISPAAVPCCWRMPMPSPDWQG